MARIDAPPASAWTPRYTLLWAALVCAVCTLMLAWPALSGGFLVNPHSDQYIAGFPFRDFAAQSLRAGDGFPLWNPYLQGGMPYIAAMHGDIFYPTFLLRLLLPTDVAMTWGFIIHLFLAGFFTVGFLRSAGMTFLPATVGGVAYMLSGQIASLVSPGHDGKLFVNALLPLACWLLLRGLRDGARWAWGALAIVVGLGVLSPHPQLLQYMLLTVGAFALFIAFVPGALASGANASTAIADSKASGPSAPNKPGAVSSDVSGSKARNPRLPRLGFALAAVVLGFLIGAVQYLPVMEYVDWSPRAGGKGYEYATSFSMPLEETLNTWIPQFTGILDSYWGRNGIHFHSEYLGVAVLLLAAAGVLGGATTRSRAHAWFWLGTGVVALFWAWGGNTPFYHLVYNLVPGSKFFRAPSTIFYVVSFAAAILAAFGTDRLLAGKLGNRFAIGAVAVGLGVALLATVGALDTLALNLAVPGREVVAEANSGALLAGAWRSALVALVVAGVVLLRNRGTLTVAATGWALVAVVALDLWSIDRYYWLFSEPADVVYAPDEAIRYVQQQDQPGRVIAEALSLENLNRRDPVLAGSALMAHSVRDVEGYHGNELGRYRRLVETAGDARLGNPNFLALTNTRFLYTNVADLPLDGFQRVAGPTRSAAGSIVYLHQYPGDNVYSWVVPLRVTADDEGTLATVLDPRFDLRRAALFPPDAGMNAQAAESVGALPEPLAVTARVTAYKPGAVDIALDGAVPDGAALVVSENFYPGWTAEVNGQPAVVSRTNYVLTGVALPAGATTVSLRFDSPPYHTGRLVTWLALALSGIAIGVGLVLDRRAGAEPAGTGART